jgi:hypothetical protein
MLLLLETRSYLSELWLLSSNIREASPIMSNFRYSNDSYLWKGTYKMLHYIHAVLLIFEMISYCDFYYLRMHIYVKYTHTHTHTHTHIIEVASRRLL